MLMKNCWRSILLQRMRRPNLYRGSSGDCIDVFQDAYDAAFWKTFAPNEMVISLPAPVPGGRRTDDPEPKRGRRCLRGRSAYRWLAAVRGRVRQMTKAVKELASLKDAVIAYVKEKYGASPENLWMRYPNYAIFRHADNGKWFAPRGQRQVVRPDDGRGKEQAGPARK